MTEKRYYTHKHLLQENKVHDKICHNFMNIDEIVEHMNNQYWKYKQLKEENEQLKQFIQSLAEQSVNGKVMLRDGKFYDLNEILKKGDVE